MGISNILMNQNYKASKEDLNWWFRSRNKMILWFMRKFSSNPKSFLEIGCGTGYVLDAIDKAFPSSALYNFSISHSPETNFNK